MHMSVRDELYVYSQLTFVVLANLADRLAKSVLRRRILPRACTHMEQSWLHLFHDPKQARVYG